MVYGDQNRYSIVKKNAKIAFFAQSRFCNGLSYSLLNNNSL